MITVLANGCFDPLHPGHVAHLEEARRLGDKLVVALTTDYEVRRQKGEKRPYLKWEERASMLRALRCVDEVIPSESGWTSVEQVRPDVFVKGEDWKERMPTRTEQACAAIGAVVVYTNAPRFGVAEFVRRIKE